jgi:type IV pilus assembly protein PilP
MSAQHVGGRLLGVLWLCALSGCMEASNEELQAWMQTERNSFKRPLEPLPEAQPFSPQAYLVEQHQDPFRSDRLSGDLYRPPPVTPGLAARFRAEQIRPKQPLEAFPLDSMSMVGSISGLDQLVALIQVEQLIYPVRTGHYLGQNHGRVSRITEQAVELRETVQDGSGAWIERSATLSLQEKALK